MEFMNALAKEASKTFTENGAIGYSTTGKALTDFNFKLPSFRNVRKEAEIAGGISSIVEARDPYLFKYLMYLRDCREGLGERSTFRKAILQALRGVSLTDEEKRTIIFSIPEYGRWDDLFVFFDTEFEEEVLSYIRSRLSVDLSDMAEGKPISLLAKWLPSNNASSKTSRYHAGKIAKFLGVAPKEYRKTLVALRKYLDVVEIKTCSNNWAEIDYNAVPSQANLRYKNAFLRHDEGRRREYLNALASGKEGVKINSAVNFPHDIVHKYADSSDYWGRRIGKYDEALEQLWKNLPDMPGLDDTLVIRDGSGSMYSHVPGSSVAALEVADALSIYCASRCKGAFKDTFITFSSEPQLVSVAAKKTLHDKLVHLRNYDDCSNTDIEAVFDLILRTAINAKLAQDDLPKRLLVISDMEFDNAHTGYGINMKSLMETIAEKYVAAGYILPKLVFWNVNSRTNTIPTSENEAGVILISGFSVNAVKMVLSGKTDPYDAIIEAVMSDRYKDIPLARYLG